MRSTRLPHKTTPKRAAKAVADEMERTGREARQPETIDEHWAQSRIEAMLRLANVASPRKKTSWNDAAAGWLKWCHDLRTRHEAITYFGDHIEENLYRTSDGHLHETYEAAADHRRRVFSELRRDHSAARVINGVRLGEHGAEVWEVVVSSSGDLAGYDAFVWHNSSTGLNHRTESLDEAILFNSEQAKILERINAAEAAAGIERRISDESGQFAIWVGVDGG